MFLYFAASGGWQEPENPHTQRVSKGSLETGWNKERWKERLSLFHFISGYGLCLEAHDIYFGVYYT